MAETAPFRWRLTLAYLILVAAVVTALGMSLANQQRIEREAEEDAARVAAEARQDDVEDCETANDIKAVILTLTERISDSNGGGTDFAAVPGFEDLAPEIQQYLRMLGSPPVESEQPGDDRLVTIAREVLVSEDCKQSDAGG